MNSRIIYTCSDTCMLAKLSWYSHLWRGESPSTFKYFHKWPPLYIHILCSWYVNFFFLRKNLKTHLNTWNLQLKRFSQRSKVSNFQLLEKNNYEIHTWIFKPVTNTLNLPSMKWNPTSKTHYQWIIYNTTFVKRTFFSDWFFSAPAYLVLGIFASVLLFLLVLLEVLPMPF